MVKRRKKDAPKLYNTVVLAMRWDDKGQAFDVRQSKDGVRAPDYDFGTPNGNLLIDPWIQELLKP